jgi:hypothetical protein
MGTNYAFSDDGFIRVAAWKPLALAMGRKCRLLLYELVSIFNLSLCYHFGKALHFFWRQQLSVPYQVRIEGCTE